MLQKTGRYFIVLYLGLLFTAPSFSLANQPSQALIEQSTLTKITKRKTLRVGFDTFVPWAMKNKQGEFIGFEVDVAKRFAKDLGVKIEMVPTAWGGIVPALLVGKFDVLIGGMSIRADRAKQVAFSMPYYYTGQSLVAHKKKAGALKSMADYNSADVSIAVRMGTTSQKAAKKLFPKAKILAFEKEPQALQELMLGRVHAFMASVPLPVQEATKHADKFFLPFDTTLTKEPIAFAMRQGDPVFENYVNSWIYQVTNEGWIEERYNYWFNSIKWKGQVE